MKKRATRWLTVTHNWLTKNGYRVHSLKNIDALPEYLLVSKKVNAVFLSALAFKSAAEKSGIVSNRYERILQERRPFGIYLSRQYLSKNPKALKRINAAIGSVKP
jgi:polar amino acid transport system substrate-binding protein